VEHRLKFPDLSPGHLREYFVRYAVYESVSNQGEQCTHCQVTAQTVECNVHATDMDGRPLYEESCLGCVPLLVDRVLDVDPSFTITVEMAEQ
jgi:hypothetical protein